MKVIGAIESEPTVDVLCKAQVRCGSFAEEEPRSRWHSRDMSRRTWGTFDCCTGFADRHPRPYSRTAKETATGAGLFCFQPPDWRASPPPTAPPRMPAAVA
jgi:hypothetical protein